MQIKLKIALSFLIVFALSNCAYFQTSTENELLANENSNAANVNSEDESSDANTNAESPDEITTLPEPEPGAIYIIFDASGSMWGVLKKGGRKIDVAKKVLNDFVSGDFSGFDLAFRAYGHRRKDDCTDTQLVVPFGDPAATITPMREFVRGVKPLGRTPITDSLRAALKDFGDRSGEIILISDGIESCDADPCALMREWRDKNVKVKVHVVGFGLDEKSRTAMKCISDAAGTEYQDAQSAESLLDALKKIRDKATSRGFILRGLDPGGNRVLTHGTLSKDGKVIYRISSNGRFQIDEGEYELSAGVRTISGNIYKPESKTVKVSAAGETRVEVKVPLPPRVKAKYIDSEGDKKRGGTVSVWKDGKNISRFRQIDEVFIDEGAFEFRAFPTEFGVSPPKSTELTVKETFSAGDRKEVVFRFPRAVRITMKIRAAGTNERFRGIIELWQNGERKYKVNTSRSVYPGTYDVILPDTLTPFEKKDVVIGKKAKQTFEFEVPVGHVTFAYQKSDGLPDKDVRVFVSRAGSNQSTYKTAGKPVALPAGKYTVAGWKNKGKTYDPVSFSIGVGEKKRVVLRAK